MEVMSPGRTRLATGAQAQKAMQYDLAKEVLCCSIQNEHINHWRVKPSKRVIERYIHERVDSLDVLDGSGGSCPQQDRSCS